MAEKTEISWAHSTFNPWIGCTRVSPACDNCYAETLATTRLGVAWGPHAERRRTSAGNWAQVRRWNRRAAAEGRVHRVFCASLADVFDNQVPEAWRADLWELIAATPALTWLLLTKRPQNIARMLPEGWGAGWSNVWLGTTVESQAEADRRIPALLGVPARLRFLSCEPLLGPVDLAGWLPGETGCDRCDDGEGMAPTRCTRADTLRSLQCPELRAVYTHDEGPRDKDGCPEWVTPIRQTIGWVIAGGESGAKARPSRPDWFYSLRDQCAAAGVPFLFKQWGEWGPAPWKLARAAGESDDAYKARSEAQAASHALMHGTDYLHQMAHAPWSLERADVMPTHATGLRRFGKKAAGALLDGREHLEFPAEASDAG